MGSNFFSFLRSYPTTLTPSVPVSNFPLAARRSFLPPIVPWSALLLVVEEQIRNFWKLAVRITNTESRETAGPRFVVLPWTPWSIPMVVVTINILVKPRLFPATRPPVAKLVLLLPGELVSSEVPGLLAEATNKFLEILLNSGRLCILFSLFVSNRHWRECMWEAVNYAFPSSWDGYNDRQQTHNFEPLVKIFVCRHVSMIFI